jgi:hypothetical protein
MPPGSPVIISGAHGSEYRNIEATLEEKKKPRLTVQRLNVVHSALLSGGPRPARVGAGDPREAKHVQM